MGLKDFGRNASSVSSVMTLSYLYTNYQEGEILNTVYEVFITNRKLQKKMRPGRKEKSQETNHAGKKTPRISDPRDTIVRNALLKAILTAGSKFATTLHVALYETLQTCFLTNNLKHIL